MANIALLIAGGSGNRMGQDIPKQFMPVTQMISKLDAMYIFH